MDQRFKLGDGIVGKPDLTDPPHRRSNEAGHAWSAWRMRRPELVPLHDPPPHILLISP